MSDQILIPQVVEFSYKSYDNYSGPETNFKRSNIIYGANGNGKSSLAKGLEDECKKHLKENEYAIFNGQYIKESFYIEDRKTLKGVKISVGKENVSTLAKIDSLQKLLVDKKERFENNNKSLKRSTGDLEAEIDKIFEVSKGSARIRKKAFNQEEPQSALESWISEYEAALKQFPEFDFSKTYSGEKTEEHLENISLYNLPQFPECQQIPADLETILQKAYDPVHESNEILNWLEAGLKFHERTSKCVFCGSSFDSETRLNEIHKILQNECKSALDNLSNLSKQLKNYIQALNHYKIDNSLLLADEKFQIIYNNLKNLSITEKKYVSELCDVIDAKIANMSSQLSIAGFANKSYSVSEITANLLTRKNQIVKRLNDESNKAAVLVKGIVGFRIKNSALVNNLLKQISEQMKTIRALTQDITETQFEINNLRDSVSDIKDFADAANDIINFLGLDLKIAVAKNNDYVIKKSRGNTIVDFDNISEGEKNLIAFLFFYINICPDLKTISPEIRVIIVDDAISSLDSNNRTYLMVLIDSLLINENSQNFVFTHCWEDSINLAYGKKGNDKFGFYECVKISGKSEICECEIKDSIYRTFFKEIYIISEKKPDKITDDEAVHAPNTMRRILESYLRFNYNIEMATEKQKEKIISAFYSGPTPSISNRDEAKLNTLLKTINIQSHGSSTPITPQKNEISMSAKYLMRIFKDHDKCHFDKMKE